MGLPAAWAPTEQPWLVLFRADPHIHKPRVLQRKVSFSSHTEVGMLSSRGDEVTLRLFCLMHM